MHQTGIRTIRRTIPVLLIFTTLWMVRAADAFHPQQSQPRGQRQSGLTPEKKRSLSNYGPEDVFPGEAADRQQQNRNATRPAQTRRPARTASAPAQTPSPTATSMPVSSPEAAPSISLPVNSDQSGAGSISGAPSQSPPDWLLPVLAALTLLVLTAFLYTLYKLYEKMREGRR